MDLSTISQNRVALSIGPGTTEYLHRTTRTPVVNRIHFRNITPFFSEVPPLGPYVNSDYSPLVCNVNR